MKFSIELSIFVTVFIFYQYFINVLAQPKYTSMEMLEIQEFRELVKDDLYMDYMKSDTYLITWLRAKKFNQKDAHVMLQEALKWRKHNKIDNILEEEIEGGLNKAFFTDGTDYNGSIVVTGLLSRINTRKYIVTGKKDSIASRIWIQGCESILQGVMKRVGVIGNETLEGNTTDLAIIIIDANEYNLREHACLTCFTVYSEWFIILRDYYPGFLKHLFFINAPRVMAPLVEFIKPLMSTQTRKGLQVFGPNKKDWYDVITKIIPANELRVEIGGTKSNLQ